MKTLTKTGLAAGLLMMVVTHTAFATTGPKRCLGHACVVIDKVKTGHSRFTFSTSSVDPLLCYASIDGHREVFHLNRESSVEYYLVDQRHMTQQLSWRCGPITPCPIWVSRWCPASK